MSNTHGWQSRAPAGRIAYVDGRYVSHGQAAVHIEDRGLQFADAVYEVFAIAGGGLCDEEEHLDRLERSLRELGIAMPMGRAPLKFVLREMVRRNRVRDGLLYLQATRGAIRRDHPVPSLGHALGALRYQINLAASQHPGENQSAHGWRLRGVASRSRRVCDRRKLHHGLDRG